MKGDHFIQLPHLIGEEIEPEKDLKSECLAQVTQLVSRRIRGGSHIPSGPYK